MTNEACFTLDGGSGEERRVHFREKLTFQQNAAFLGLMDEIRRAPDKNWVFDFGKLTTIDSSGLAMLLMARDVVSNAGGQLALAKAKGRVRSMIELTRFDELFPLKD